MKLIFVYNADSGWMNTLIDIGHKALSPQTYECNLCGLTFGLVSEHKQWKQFREESDTEMEFLHRDEFEQKYARKFKYPVILKEDNDLSVAISQAELNQIKTLDELISQVKIVSKMPGSR
ncbi:MAG: GTPase [Xenococcaceae cyanobacterium MO_207.B15]|nr:GTPase [Xenococcaceae cyanobacterium MO_207.B15]MDJ0743524.1 GTPase [Xenococcaceae cyanobacterium MO_167.B27]